MHEKSQVKTHRCLGRADAHNMSAFQERNPTISATRSGLTGVYPTGSLRKCLRSVKWAEISIWSYFGLFWPVTDLSEVGHVGVRCGDLVLRFLIRRIALWSDTDVEAKPFVTRNPQRETLPNLRSESILRSLLKITWVLVLWSQQTDTFRLFRILITVIWGCDCPGEHRSQESGENLRLTLSWIVIRNSDWIGIKIWNLSMKNMYFKALET